MSKSAYELRARLRTRAITARVRDCGRRAVGNVAVVVRESSDGSRTAGWAGVLRCGRSHSCPVCAQRKATERAETLERLLANDRAGRWQMVTFTVRHRAGEALRVVLERLMAAFRRVRAMRKVRAIYDARVTASVRALEITWGANGWHPHIHLLLRTTEWPSQEKAKLEDAWHSAVDSVPGVAVQWSRPLESHNAQKARYLSKLGCELAGVGKQPKLGNLSPWQLAVVPRHAELWAEYQRTMHGRRMLELDERAKALAGEAPVGETAREWRIELYSEELAYLAASESTEPAVLWEFLEVARCAEDPETAARSALYQRIGPKTVADTAA